MSIRILKPSLLTTVVSNGREGFRSLGIGSGGAMDKFAMHVANYLVGNVEDEAVIELGYSATEILFQQDQVVCITGKGFTVIIDELPIPLWKPFKIKDNAVLKIQKSMPGAWAYLSVHGGWKVEKWLGSQTTNLSAHAGGFHGRALQKGDVIEWNENKIHIDETRVLPWGISVNELNEIYAPKEVRCLSSIETSLLSADSKKKFVSGEFTISSQSNRMGYRLKGPTISLNEKMELISSPVDFGTLQLLPDGNLIVLMADHQTIGGYPRIASVIKADQPKLAQLLPGDKVNFKMIAVEEAEAELISREQRLQELKKNCIARFNDYFK
jgi:antagonist of KipI